MDFTEALVWETEGRRGAAERGWLGEEERQREERRQIAVHEEAEDGLGCQCYACCMWAEGAQMLEEGEDSNG
jgi:hypothetical protein